jgi:outer membrane protein
MAFSGDKMRYSKQLALFALVMIATALGSGTLEAQSGKIGVINTNAVLGESAAGVAAGTAFQTYATERQQPLVDLETEINVKSQQLQDQQRALSETAIAQRTAELDRLQRNFTRGQEDLALDLETKQAEVLEPVYALANSVIEAFATEQGYQMIIDPTAAQGILVYMDDNTDVTLEIIARMDEAYAASGSDASSPAPASDPPAVTTPTP